jgi:hypothetical protein
VIRRSARDKWRILGSGFTAEEYRLYRFEDLDDPGDAMRFLSNRMNHSTCRPAINRGYQQHILEDKWVTQLFMTSQRVPVPETYGVYHPEFGATCSGAPLCTPEQLADVVRADLPLTVFLKPRGGRKGRDVHRVEMSADGNGGVQVSSGDQVQSLADFLAGLPLLPRDGFDHYGGCYHGWLVQRCLRQHEFLNHINPHTVNSIRVITFVDAGGKVHVQLSVLRLGRKGNSADNWDKGGISVGIEPETGTLGRGVYKPRYGGTWVSEHPDTGVRFEGLVMPEWQAILDICHRSAALFSGIRSVGWDIALTPAGPVVVEGNALWDLPMVQVHTRGYLTPEVREQLKSYGVELPDRLKSLPLALLILLVYQWQRSRGPRILRGVRYHLQRFIRA